jgi:hypothetical protein
LQIDIALEDDLLHFLLHPLDGTVTFTQKSAVLRKLSKEERLKSAPGTMIKLW